MHGHVVEHAHQPVSRVDLDDCDVDDEAVRRRRRDAVLVVGRLEVRGGEERDGREPGLHPVRQRLGFQWQIPATRRSDGRPRRAWSRIAAIFARELVGGERRRRPLRRR